MKNIYKTHTHTYTHTHTHTHIHQDSVVDNKLTLSATAADIAEEMTAQVLGNGERTKNEGFSLIKPELLLLLQ